MANKYWRAFDLHMHTVPGITGDGKREHQSGVIGFSFCNFIQSLKDVDISLFSITNHNYIYLDNFILCKYLAKRIGINSLLGVELDVNDNSSSDYHMACIFDCDIVEALDLSKFINSKASSYIGTGSKLRYTSSDIGTILERYRVVLIPHCPTKNPGIPLNNQQDVIELMKKVKEGYLCILDEKSQWDLGYLKQCLDDTDFYKYADDIGAAFFSDNKNWLPGEYKKRLQHVTCMNSEPTFKGLIHCLTNPTERFTFQEYIPSYSNYISKIEIKNLSSESLFKSSTILLQPGYNCIIGRSGSGKSLIIHLLKKYLLAKQNAVYGKYDNPGAEVHLYDEHGDEISINSINVGVGEGIFNKLIEAIDADDSNTLTKIINKLDSSYSQFNNFKKYRAEYTIKIQSYFDLREDYNKKYTSLVSELNLFDTNYKTLCKYSDLSIARVEGVPAIIPFDLTSEEMLEINNYKLSFEKLTRIVSLLDKLKIADEIGDETTDLEAKFKKAARKANHMQKTFAYKMKKIDIVNKSIESINRLVSINAGNKSTLESYFRNNIEIIANDIVALYKQRNTIDGFDLSIEPELMKETLDINHDGTIKIVEDIEDDVFKKANLRERKVYNTYGLSIINDSIFDLTKKYDSKMFFDSIYESARFEYKTDIVSQKIFSDIKPTLMLLFNGQDVKTLNSGDIAKTYLKNYFDHQLGDGNSIVIYDQLENDVDKEFIKNELLVYLSNLKKRIQLIVVTHDPIIAVNGDPVNYVIAEKDINRMIGYRSFVPESELRDELETLANTVDGSKEVIRERYRVYKGESL